MARVRHAAMIIAIVAGGAASVARAADTIEPFELGASNLDLYLGLDGMGRGPYEKATFGDIMLGFGLTPSLSAYLGTTLQANEYLLDGSAVLYFGLFFNVIDSAVVDFDLMLDVCAGGHGFSHIGLTPALELNIDFDPEMRSGGLYLRLAESLGGIGEEVPGRVTPNGNPIMRGCGYQYATAVVFGAYATVSEGHQLLLEYDMAFDLTPGSFDRVAMGGVTFGYNAEVGSGIELINHVFVDIPAAGKTVAAGVMVGFIATLPTSNES